MLSHICLSSTARLYTATEYHGMLPFLKLILIATICIYHDVCPAARETCGTHLLLGGNPILVVHNDTTWIIKEPSNWAVICSLLKDTL